MSGSLPAFQSAADLGPSPSREAELEDLCSRQARELEQLRDAAEQPVQQARPAAQAGIEPEERQALIQLLSDLREQAKEHSRDIERLKKENADLKKSLAEAQQDISWIQDSFPPQIAECRRRLKAIEGQAIASPQKKQVRLGEILISILVANGGKMLAIDARHKLGISKPAFSLLLRTISDKIELKHFHLDRRKYVIILKSRN